jgi:hypothetical protein
VGAQGKDAPVVPSLPKGQDFGDQFSGRLSEKETAGSFYPDPEAEFEWVGCASFSERLVETSSGASGPFVGPGLHPWTQRSENIPGAASADSRGAISGVCPGT